MAFACDHGAATDLDNTKELYVNREDYVKASHASAVVVVVFKESFTLSTRRVT
jgi:hypothetical protein